MSEDTLSWYKDSVIYQTHVKAFFDSNGDGTGDFQGLKSKLDYLVDLGIDALWLLPFYPSPLRDDGYDIADSRGTHPAYGTLRDFKDFLREAHRRDLKVITELVLNHTSDQHPWFQRARRAKPGSSFRNFYVWSDDPERYGDARIIFQDFESSNWSWDSTAKAYYWHRFYSHQPDLNYDNPRVQEAMLRIIDFWFGLGIDGLRLDAVPYLYQRAGTNCENLPETHDFLKKLRRHVDGKHRDKMLLAEANQWPEDAAAYFGNADECHMAFHFPLMPRMFMAVQMEDRFPIIDILEQTPPIDESCQWAIFLRNHDELTLEMVTDEERDYMYRVFAGDPRSRINLGIRRRLAPLLGNNRRKIELMNILLFSLPGTPVIYYGDEIGMGDNYYLGDRDGVRTPMQWSPDRSGGFSRANPQRLYLPVIIDPEYHYEALNVENQQSNSSSLLWWMKRTLAMRRRYRAFGRGDLTFLQSENGRVLSFTRCHGDEIILVVCNLSRFSQVVELDLSAHAGTVPMDVFSQNAFPPVREAPYMLMIGPHGYHIFSLRREREAGRPVDEQDLPEVRPARNWEQLLSGSLREEFETSVLPRHLKKCRWFKGWNQILNRVRIVGTIPVGNSTTVAHLCLLEVTYGEGVPETYLLPLAFSSDERVSTLAEDHPSAIVARATIDGSRGFLYDGVHSRELRDCLLELVERKRRVGSKGLSVAGRRGKSFPLPARRKKSLENSRVLRAGQEDTLIVYDNTLVLKITRRLEEGTDPDTEIARRLSERGDFPHIPPYAGQLELQSAGVDPTVIGHLQGYVHDTTDAWTHTLDTVGRYFERVLALGREEEGEEAHSGGRIRLAQELAGTFTLEMASLLGRRTAELHLALAGFTDDQDFCPQPFSLLYQRSIYQSMRSSVRRTFQRLSRKEKNLPEEIRPRVRALLGKEKKMLLCLQGLLARKFSAMKIRIHGNLDLAQVLFTGKDFVFVDFEGDPSRPLGERRLLRSPLRDTAGMLQSFHYAAHTALRNHPSLRPDDIPLLRPWADRWFHLVGKSYLSGYFTAAGGAPFLPALRAETTTLLRSFVMERAVADLNSELLNRPDFVSIPLSGIEYILEKGHCGEGGEEEEENNE